jgi:enoyl-CoA hydratase
VISVEAGGPVATIRIERPERRNALNLDAVVALDEAVGAVAAGDARALVLCGTEGHFCAGADLTELEDLAFTRRLRTMLDHLAGLPIVTIAAISGSCMGLGMQLALACDVRVATEDARFAVPVAKLGLMVDHWTLERLAAVFGHGAARHLVLCAEVLDAADGHRLGFVQELGDEAAARALAERVATLAPLSIEGSKLGLDTLAHRPDTAAYEEAFRRAWQSEDLAEGRAAFAEKRTPEFRGA